ncbi:MAG: caspase family protein [Gimesia chilikensis]|uniref:caspase family protein n=1 Tax=Gimesia chilikensis TaxID=2605989 RepID=UPI0037BDE888
MHVGMKQRVCFRLLALLLLLLISQVSHAAEELRLVKAVETASSPDTAILTIEAPASAEIYIGTENYKDQRKFEMSPLKDGHFYDYQIQVVQKGDVIAAKNLQLRAGLDVSLKVIPIDPRPLRLQAQTGVNFSRHMAFSGDGKYLASADDFSCVVIDLETRREVSRFQHRHLGDQVTRITFENDSDRSEAIRLYRDVYQPDLKQTVSLSALYRLRDDRFTRFREAPAVKKSPAETGNDLCEWSVTGRRVYVRQRKSPFRQAHFTLPRELLNAMQICLNVGYRKMPADLRGARPQNVDDLLEYIIADASFSDDGKWLAVGINKPYLDGDPDCPVIPCCFIWDLERDTLYSDHCDFRNNAVPPAPVPTSVKFSPDSKTLAIGNSELLLFSMSQRKVTDRFGSSGTGLGGIALPVDPYSDSVVMSAGSWTGVWDRKQGDLLTQIPTNGEYGISHVALSGDGKVAQTHAWSGSNSSFWNTQTGRVIGRPRGGMPSYALKLNHDGTRYLTAGTGAALFETAGSRELRKYSDTVVPYFSNGGVSYVTRSSSFPPKISDHYSEITAVSADGKRCAVTQNTFKEGGSHYCQVYQLPSRQLLFSKVVARAPRIISNVELSPLGHFLTVHEEPGQGSVGRLAVYNIDRDSIMLNLANLRDTIRSLAFNARETLLFVGYGMGIVDIYSMVTGELIATVTLMSDTGEWLISTPDGLFDGTLGARNKICYRFDGELTTVPVDRFFMDYYSSGLFARVLAGEVPRAGIKVQNNAPSIRILSPTIGGEISENQVVIEVEVIDQGGGVSGPWLRQNGAKVKSMVTQKGTGKTSRYTFPLSLVSGENRIMVEAASGDGSLASEPRRINFEYYQTVDKPDLYVVAIGVNKYASESMNLNFSVNDAQAIAQLFRQRGDSLYNDVHVRELMDEQATRLNIRKAFRSFAELAKPQDTLLVYLSGHGKTISQRYYFLPHEFEIRSKNFVDDIRDYGYPIDELSEAMVDVKALKRVLILDTCHSGAAIEKSGNRSRNPFGFRGAIKRLSRAEGIFTIAAAPASEETVENAELQHGILTYSLLAGLKSVNTGPLSGQHIKTNNSSQIVDVLEWFSYANDRVPELTQKYRGRPQDVQMSTAGTSFPILPLE